jgi:hypothetical protein
MLVVFVVVALFGFGVVIILGSLRVLGRTMTNQWILPTVILVALFGVVGIPRLAGYLKLMRMRALCCPDCHMRFSVPSLTAVRRWRALDGTVGSGFWLRCEHCGADYTFSDRYELLEET